MYTKTPGFLPHTTTHHHASAAAHVFAWVSIAFPALAPKSQGAGVQSATHAHDGGGGAKFVSISHLQQDHTTYTCQFLQHRQKLLKNANSTIRTKILKIIKKIHFILPNIQT